MSYTSQRQRLPDQGQGSSCRMSALYQGHPVLLLTEGSRMPVLREGTTFSILTDWQFKQQLSFNETFCLDD